MTTNRLRDSVGLINQLNITLKQHALSKQGNNAMAVTHIKDSDDTKGSNKLSKR